MYGKVSSVNILPAAQAVGAGESHELWHKDRTFQANGLTSDGAGAAQVDIEASNDGVNFIVLGSINLVLSATKTAAGFASDAPWRYCRANVKSISGNSATIDVWMGAMAP